MGNITTIQAGAREDGGVELSGRCACGKIHYRLGANPLIVHACHCRDCQRITGGPFVINLWIERKFVTSEGVEPRSFRLTGGSGKAHDVFFCGDCGTYLWSFYHGAPGAALFVRAGTLEHPEAVRPDVHIFTRDKLPWIQLPAQARAFETFYKLDEVFSDAAKARLAANRAESVSSG